jgi:hypothetical protein
MAAKTGLHQRKIMTGGKSGDQILILPGRAETANKILDRHKLGATGRSCTWSSQISSPRLLCHASACPGYEDAGSAYWHHARASMQGSYIGLVAVCSALQSAAALADAVS